MNKNYSKLRFSSSRFAFGRRVCAGSAIKHIIFSIGITALLTAMSFNVSVSFPPEICTGVSEDHRGVLSGPFSDLYSIFQVRDAFRGPECRESIYDVIEMYSSVPTKSESALVRNFICVLAQIGDPRELDRLFKLIDSEELRLGRSIEMKRRLLPCLAANDHHSWAFEYISKFARNDESMVRAAFGDTTQPSSNSYRPPGGIPFQTDSALNSLALVGGKEPASFMKEVFDYHANSASRKNDCFAGPTPYYFDRYNQNMRALLRLMEIQKIRQEYGFARAFRFQEDMKARYQWDRFDLDRFQRDPAADFELPSPVLVDASIRLLSESHSGQIRTKQAIARNLLRAATIWDAGVVSDSFLRVLHGPTQSDLREATAEEFDFFLGLLRDARHLVENTERLLPGVPMYFDQIRWFADETSWQLAFSLRYSISGLTAQEAARRAAMAGLDGIAAVGSADSCCLLSSIAADSSGENYSKPVLNYARELVTKHCPADASFP